MKKGFVLLLITFALTALLAPRAALAACVNPAGNEGNQVYNTTYKTMQFCDGNTWISMKGGVGTDTLHAMSCADGEVIKWNDGATAWECATDSSLGAESDPKVDAVTSNKWCRGTGSQVTCDQDAPSGDNLGNHTATATLALGANAMTSSAGTIRDGNGGWVRTYGNTGWYNGTHGGGWHMSDTTWIRSYGGKWIYTDTGIRADGDGVRTNQICNTGGGNCVAQSALSGGGAPAGTWCGMRIIRCSTGGSLSYPSSVDSWVSSFACNGQTITGSCTGTFSNVPVANCPSGYASQVLYGVSGGSTNTNVMTCRKT